MAKYLVYLEPAEEGGYIVYCPALPGCVTQGETKEEALAMIKDAIEGYISSLKKHGEPVPPGIEEAVHWFTLHYASSRPPGANTDPLSRRSRH